MGILYNSCDKQFFDATISDQIRVAGEEIWLYSLIGVSPGVDPTIDPLYDEPKTDSVTGNEQFKYTGPYKAIGILKKTNTDLAAQERGEFADTTGSQAIFARFDLEQLGIPGPKNGDIVAWQGTKFFDVVNVNREGNIADTREFVKYVCDIRVVDSFRPDRKLDTGDVIGPTT